MNALSEQAHGALDALVNGIEHLTAVEKEQNEKIYPDKVVNGINYIIVAEFRSYDRERLNCRAKVYDDSSNEFYHKEFDLMKSTKEEVEHILAEVEAKLKEDHRVRTVELLRKKLAEAEEELAKAELAE